MHRRKVRPQFKIFIGVVLLIVFFLGFFIGWLTTASALSEIPETIPTANVTAFEVIQTASVTPQKEIIPETPAPLVYYDVPLSEDIQDYIRGLCDEMDVPMALVIAIIDTESTFQSTIISKTYDYGLMQINRNNHEWLSETYGVSNFLDPYENVYCGITILSSLLSDFDTVEQAVVAYNRGATGARNLFSQGIYSTEYSQEVMTAYTKYTASPLVDKVDDK